MRSFCLAISKWVSECFTPLAIQTFQTPAKNHRARCHELFPGDAIVLFRLFGIGAISIIEDPRISGGDYNASRTMFHEPVAVHLTDLLRCSGNGHGRLGGKEGIVMYGNNRPGDIRAILTGAAAVHVKTMAERVVRNDIVPRNVIAAGPSRTGNGMTVPIKDIVFNDGIGQIMGDAIAQAVVLAMVNEVVMNVVVCPCR